MQPGHRIAIRSSRLLGLRRGLLVVFAGLLGLGGAPCQAQSEADVPATPVESLTAAPQARRVIHVGVFQNDPKIFHEGGAAMGILPELLGLIAAEENWVLEYRPCEWQRCLDLLEAGELDLMPDVAYTSERAHKFDFHRSPALHSWAQLFTRADKPLPSLFALNGKRLALLDGSIQEDAAKAMFRDYGIQFGLLRASSIRGIFEMVRDGRADAGAANHYFGAAHAEEYGLVESPVVFLPSQVYWAAPKGRNADLLIAIDRHLNTWRAHPDSPYFRILGQWLKPTASPPHPSFDWHIPVIGALAALAALLAIVIARIRLRGQVRVLDDSRNRLQGIIDALPDLMFEVDADGRYLDYHTPRADLLAAPPAALLGRLMTDVLPPDAAGAAKAALAVAIREGHSAGHVMPLDLPSGRHWFELSIARKPSGPGREPTFIIISRDVSERKRAEEDMRIAAIAFESQEGMFITDADRVIVRVNHAFAAQSGFDANRLIGRPASELADPEHGSFWVNDIAHAIAQQGVWQGELRLRRADGNLCPSWVTVSAVRDDAGILTHYVVNVVDITYRKQAEEEIRQLAFFDSLTGLPNRRLMLDRLDRAQKASARRNRHGCLMLLDLDNFKLLNDTLGHDVGDDLLIEAAARLKSCVRDGDTVARLGGDEFVVILDDLDDSGMAAAHAEAVATKILFAMDAPFELTLRHGSERGAVRQHHCSCSIGLTLFMGVHTSVDELLKRADTAMYQAKNSGRNALRFYDPDMQAATIAQATLEAELRQAIDNNQFVLHFQPQFDARHSVIGAEAVLRWQHPKRGLLAPASFLPLAEESGLSVGIGIWMLDAVSAQLAAWAHMPGLAHLTLAMDVTPRQFGHHDFVDHVFAAFGNRDAPTERFQLHLTEGVLSRDVDAAVAKMEHLRAQGIRIALDEFGSGVSSLTTLRRLPLDQIRIEATLALNRNSDPRDAAVARAVLDLCTSFGLEIVGTGIASTNQFNFLAEHGCARFQGDWLSEPLSAPAFVEYVARVAGAASAPATNA